MAEPVDAKPHYTRPLRAVGTVQGAGAKGEIVPAGQPAGLTARDHADTVVHFNGRQDNIMSIRRLSRAFLAAACLAAVPAAAQLYKWTDANGRVQYSDKPPASGQKAETVNRANLSTVPGAGSPASGGASAPKSVADQEQEFRKRRAEQEEAQKKAQKLAEEQRSKQANCQSAQRQLAGLQAGGRITRMNEKGEREFLDDAAIQQEIGRAQAEVGRWCN